MPNLVFWSNPLVGLVQCAISSIENQDLLPYEQEVLLVFQRIVGPQKEVLTGLLTKQKAPSCLGSARGLEAMSYRKYTIR